MSSEFSLVANDMYWKLKRTRPRFVKLLTFAASYVFCVFIINLTIIKEKSDSYVESLQKIRDGKISKPEEVKSPSAEYINLGMIVINLQKTEELDNKFLDNVEKTFNGIFLFSSGTPIHFMIVTDKISIASVSLALADIISENLASQVILGRSWKWRRRKGLPPLKFSYVDIDDILDVNRNFVKALKKNGENAKKDKYAADLFFISPLYHRAFLAIDRLIFLDSTDLVLVSDIGDLQDQFENIVDDAVMKVGLDLSPHYRTNLADYIKTHPETQLGLPGRYQGLNTGVVLFDLEKMRKSTQYNNYLTPDKVDDLFKTYHMKMTVGDQDWLTLLSFQQPNLFSILPCQFNTQTSLQYWSSDKATFHSYHHCDVPNNINIYHCNGCGPRPEDCGSQPAPVAEYREYIHIFIQIILPYNFWAFLANVRDSAGRDIIY